MPNQWKKGHVMKLVVKSNYLVDQTFENVQSVYVQVDRVEGDVWYYVEIVTRGFYSSVEMHCVAAYQDLNKALDLNGQIKASLNSGKEKLEVSI